MIYLLDQAQRRTSNAHLKGHTRLEYNILGYSNLGLIAQGLSGEALYKNQVRRLIDIRVVSAEKGKERRLRVCVVGVGEAVLDTPC